MSWRSAPPWIWHRRRGEAASLTSAFNQLQTYKAQVPSLFRTNAVLVTTDGIQARIGSLTADQERFMPWRTTDGADVAPKGSPEMSVLIEGVFQRGRLLSLMQDFTVFGDTPGGIAKIIAGYLRACPRQPSQCQKSIVVSK